jgi:hypothetical protein
MATTMILSILFFALAVLGLSIGVILKKRTPLKGECHGPVDGGGTCSTCGAGADEGCDASDEVEIAKRDALEAGNFQIQEAPRKIELHR